MYKHLHAFGLQISSRFYPSPSLQLYRVACTKQDDRLAHVPVDVKRLASVIRAGPDSQMAPEQDRPESVLTRDSLLLDYLIMICLSQSSSPAVRGTHATWNMLSALSARRGQDN